MLHFSFLNMHVGDIFHHLFPSESLSKGRRFIPLSSLGQGHGVFTAVVDGEGGAAPPDVLEPAFVAVHARADGAPDAVCGPPHARRPRHLLPSRPLRPRRRQHPP